MRQFASLAHLEFVQDLIKYCVPESLGFVDLVLNSSSLFDQAVQRCRDFGQPRVAQVKVRAEVILNQRLKFKIKTWLGQNLTELLSRIPIVVCDFHYLGSRFITELKTVINLYHQDSDDEKRVVKSKKDKASDTVMESVVRIRNLRKVNDWPALVDEFNKVNEMVAKTMKLGLLTGIPKFYIKMLADLQDQVTETVKDKDSIKKMTKVGAKAVDRMKLIIKKHNDTFKDEIADCRANPDKYEDEEKEEESSDESSDEDSDDSDNDSDEDSGEESSDDSDEDVKKKPKAKKVRLTQTLNACPFAPISPHATGI
jgi:hypothetical protein